MTTKLLCTLDGENTQVQVFQDEDGRCHCVADADIDADGAPHAYHPDQGKGLDLLANAMDQHGEFVGILTNSKGEPLRQSDTDPAPGFYISTTAYEISAYPRESQRRYLNSETIPFIVVSPKVRATARGIILGCRARATNLRNGQTVECVVGDIGPSRKIGEISICAAKALGIPSSPKTGGTDADIILYEFWPGEPAVIGSNTYSLIPA